MTVQKTVKQLYQIKKRHSILMSKLNKFLLLFCILFLLSAECFYVKKGLPKTSSFHPKASTGSSLCMPVHTVPLPCIINTERLENISFTVSLLKIKSALHSVAAPCILKFFQSLILLFISLFSFLCCRNKFLSIVSFTETLF